MKRYEIVAITNDESPSDPYPTLLITEDEDGEFVRHDDAQAEIDRLREALQWQVDHYDPTSPEVAHRKAKEDLLPNTPDDKTVDPAKDAP